jgi:hypothetical protein
VEKVFYLSPTQKVHSQDCRHCRKDNQGWTKLTSLAVAIENGYNTCRLCCPPLSEIETAPKSTIMEVKSKSDSQSTTEQKSLSTSKQELKPKLESELSTEIKSESISSSDSQQQINSQEEKESSESESKSDSLPEAKSLSESQSSSDSQDRQKKDRSPKKKSKNQNKEETEKKRYKILAGNGCHQAIAEVQGMLMRPTDTGEKFKLILPDGFEIDATFKNPRLKWLAYNNDTVIGLHWFRGYPKMAEGKLVCFQIIAWNGDMPTSPQGLETWEFTGLWTPQKNLTVQRSMTMKEIRTIAKETGFIKKFKYSFTNSQEWVANKKLWIGYVYKLLCYREGDTLKIKKVIPFACPRIKPVPKGKGDSKGKDKFQGKDSKKGDLKAQKESSPPQEQKN